jgi:hypothetical protein
MQSGALVQDWIRLFRDDLDGQMLTRDALPAKDSDISRNTARSGKSNRMRRRFAVRTLAVPVPSLMVRQRLELGQENPFSLLLLLFLLCPPTELLLTDKRTC